MRSFVANIIGCVTLIRPMQQTVAQFSLLLNRAVELLKLRNKRRSLQRSVSLQYLQTTVACVESEPEYFARKGQQSVIQRNKPRSVLREMIVKPDVSLRDLFSESQ